MLDWLKRTMVESYMGAIALGYLFAQIVLHFVGIFASPVVSWVARDEYRQLAPRTPPSAEFVLEFALPELARFTLLLLVWYFLLRWLYFKPHSIESPEPAENSN
jgi:hypothetical protein